MRGTTSLAKGYMDEILELGLRNATGTSWAAQRPPQSSNNDSKTSTSKGSKRSRNEEAPDVFAPGSRGNDLSLAPGPYDSSSDESSGSELGQDDELPTGLGSGIVLTPKDLQQLTQPEIAKRCEEYVASLTSQPPIQEPGNEILVASSSPVLRNNVKCHPC